VIIVRNMEQCTIVQVARTKERGGGKGEDTILIACELKESGDPIHTQGGTCWGQKGIREVLESYRKNRCRGGRVRGTGLTGGK